MSCLNCKDFKVCKMALNIKKNSNNFGVCDTEILKKVFKLIAINCINYDTIRTNN